MEPTPNVLLGERKTVLDSATARTREQERERPKVEREVEFLKERGEQ